MHLHQNDIDIVKYLPPSLLHLTPGSHDFGYVHSSFILEPKTGWKVKVFQKKIPLWVHGGPWWVRWLQDEMTVNSLVFFSGFLVDGGSGAPQNKQIISSISSFVIGGKFWGSILRDTVH